MHEPRWPLWLWSLQLVPIALLLFLALWVLAVKDQGDGGSKAPIALAIGVAWAFTVFGMLVSAKGRKWLVSHRKEWCLTAGSLLVCVVLADVGLNTAGTVPTIESQRASSLTYAYGRYTRYRLVAKKVQLKDGDPIRINRRGFRGDEIEAEKKPGQARILFLGGSQVFDYRGGGWPAMVGDELRLAGHDIDVINAGVPGHSTFDSLGKLVTDAWTLKPDIIILCQAWNDIKYFAWLSPEKPYRGFAPRTSVSWQIDWRLYPHGIDRVLSSSAIYRQFRWRIGQFLYSYEGDERGDYDVGETLAKDITQWGPPQYRLNLALIAELSEAIGAELIFCKQAHLAVIGGTGKDQEAAQQYGVKNARVSHEALMRGFEFTYAIIDEIAADRNIKIIDMNDRLSGRKEYFHDGIHFSPAGSRVAAELVSETILPAVLRSIQRQESQ